jgi:hypothetical protein
MGVKSPLYPTVCMACPVAARWLDLLPALTAGAGRIQTILRVGAHPRVAHRLLNVESVP